MTNKNRVQLLACYELGHQPLSIAWPLAFLAQAGIGAAGHDLSVDSFPDEAIGAAQFVGISVPMHTALRLGVEAAKRIRELNPSTHIAFLGYYAQLNSDFLLQSPGEQSKTVLADSVLSGEYEEQLVELVKRTLANGSGIPAGIEFGPENGRPFLERMHFPLPERTSLPHLSKYSRFIENGSNKLTGYTEASRGCLHTCRHCPVVPIYEGRFFVVPADIVLADVRQQVEAGAEHITFGDPDFLNGPGHSLRITRAIHDEFPQLTFDFTTKVEHIIENKGEIEELKELGAAFVISAFESTSDKVLSLLEKGHTRADLEQALLILNHINLPVQPTWVPFTPWTSMEGYLEMLSWVRQNGLINNIPPVQYSVRLLVPPNSALLNHNQTKNWFGDLNPAEFVHEWRHENPRMDHLQRTVAMIAESSGMSYSKGFSRIERAAYKAAGRQMPEYEPAAEPRISPPRLTEDWFC